MEIAIKIGGFFASAIIAFIVGFMFGGFRRLLTARVQNRYGPPFYQNLIDIIKLQSKETNINHGIMQHMGPMFAITASVTTLLFIPILRDNNFFPNFSFQGDLIFLLYIMVFGQLGMALGAGQTGNPYSAIGVSRGLTQMIGYEIPFVMALVAIMIEYKTTSIHDLLNAQNEISKWIMFQNPFAFIAAMLAFLGMSTYTPFDVPFAPAELASGPPSEFGGKYLGTMMTSGAIFAFAKLVLFVDLFMGGADNFITLAVKAWLIYLFPILVSIVTPRYRTEQAMMFFFKWPTVFGLLALLYAAWK